MSWRGIAWNPGLHSVYPKNKLNMKKDRVAYAAADILSNITHKEVESFFKKSAVSIT